MSRRTKSDQLAAQVARKMGLILSTEDHNLVHDANVEDDLGGETNSDTGRSKSTYNPEKFDAAQLARRLLRALGEEVASPTDDELINMLAKKISELRRGGSDQHQPSNPLMDVTGKIEPVAMSLTNDQQRAVEILSRKMGAAPTGAGAAFATNNVTKEDKLADLLVRCMPRGGQ